MTPFTIQTSFTFVPVTLREMHESLAKIDKVTPHIMWCQYGIGILGLCCIVSEEFDYKLKHCFGLQKYNIRDIIPNNFHTMPSRHRLCNIQCKTAVLNFSPFNMAHLFATMLEKSPKGQQLLFPRVH